MQLSDLILKTLLKNPDKECQNEWADCIASLVSDYPCNFISWATVWPELMVAAIREMEMGSTNKIMLHLMKVRLSESK